APEKAVAVTRANTSPRRELTPASPHSMTTVPASAALMATQVRGRTRSLRKSQPPRPAMTTGRCRSGAGGGRRWSSRGPPPRRARSRAGEPDSLLLLLRLLLFLPHARALGHVDHLLCRVSIPCERLTRTVPAWTWAVGWGRLARGEGRM